MATRAIGARALGGRIRTLVDIAWGPTLALMLLIIVLPTAAYAFAAEWMGFAGQRLNFDFFALYLVTVFLAPCHRSLALVTAVAGVITILSIQVLLGVGVIYLDNPALIVEYLSFIAYWPWRLISFWLLVAAIVFTGFTFVLRRVPIERAAALPALAALALLFTVDAIGQTPRGQALVGGNWVTSSAFRGYLFTRKVIVGPKFNAKPFGEPTMVDEVVASKVPPRLLSVSVEALGVAAADPAFNEAMFAPLRKEMAGSYDVQIGEHSFRGTTLAGELRELCSQETVGKPSSAEARTMSRGCLPARLRAAGYATFGIHGNAKHFYNRSLVYPALGFSHTKFYDDYAASGRSFKVCRYEAFQGACDDQVFDDALAFLAQHPRAYAHVMTLDTHFPLGVSELGDDRCGRVRGLNDSALCLYVNQLGNYLAKVGRQIRTTRVPPDKVILFGDHAPPFVEGRLRNYFNRQKVPVIVLTRRHA